MFLMPISTSSTLRAVLGIKDFGSSAILSPVPGAAVMVSSAFLDDTLAPKPVPIWVATRTDGLHTVSLGWLSYFGFLGSTPVHFISPFRSAKQKQEYISVYSNYRIYATKCVVTNSINELRKVLRKLQYGFHGAVAIIQCSIDDFQIQYLICHISHIVM